jgi:hypothetical protein
MDRKYEYYTSTLLRVNNAIILETVATNLDNYFVKW